MNMRGLNSILNKKNIFFLLIIILASKSFIIKYIPNNYIELFKTGLFIIANILIIAFIKPSCNYINYIIKERRQ